MWDDGWHWLSNESMTVYVRVHRGRIVQAPPIVKRFMYQHLRALLFWMNKQPGLVHQRIRVDE